MNQFDELLEFVRRRLIGDLHIGRVRPGDRLPSVREVARLSGADHRVVRKVYRALADEGLVEVRRRSGVIVADPGRKSDAAVRSEDGWFADLASEAWLRRVPLQDLPRLLEHRIAPVRCACVESTEDHEVAICTELQDDFGLQVRPVRLDGGAKDVEGDLEVLDHVLAEVDMVVTTAFHADLVAPVAARLGKPLVLVTVNEELRRRIAALLARGDVRVVIADPQYVARARAYMRDYEEGVHYRFIMCEAADREALLEQSDRVLITRAARLRLGIEGHHLLAGGGPFLSEDTARQVAAVVVRINSSRSVGPRPSL